MSFSKVSPSILKGLTQGRDLTLKVIMPNRIIKEHLQEVALLQHTLDSVLAKFNRRIDELQSGKLPKAKVEFKTNGGEKPKKMSKAEKAMLLKKTEDEKKGGGGTPL